MVPHPSHVIADRNIIDLRETWITASYRLVANAIEQVLRSYNEIVLLSVSPYEVNALLDIAKKYGLDVREDGHTYRHASTFRFILTVNEDKRLLAALDLAAEHGYGSET